MHSVILAAAESGSYELPPLWRLSTKFLYFIGLAGLIGFPVTALLTRGPLGPAAEATTRRLVLGSAAVMIPLFYLSTASRVLRGPEPPADSFVEALGPAAISRFLTAPARAGEWMSMGAMVTTQWVLLAATVALIGAYARGVRPTLSLSVASVLAIALSLLGSLPRSADKLAAAGLVSSALIQGHIVGGSVWAGGLVFLALLARRVPRPARAAGWEIVWQRFGIAALYSVGLVLVSGLWLTWTHVGMPAEMLTTTFGRVLTVKILLVAALMAAGGYNQFVLLPGIARARAADDEAGAVRLACTAFPRVVLTESVLIVAVLASVPFLTGSARAEAGSGKAGALSAAILAVGLIVIAIIAQGFRATLLASEALGRRPADSSPSTGATGAATDDTGGATDREDTGAEDADVEPVPAGATG